MNKTLLVIISFLIGALLSGLVGVKWVVSSGQVAALDAALMASKYLSINKNSPDSLNKILIAQASCNLKLTLETRDTIWGHDSAHVQAFIDEIHQNGISEEQGCDYTK